MPANEFPLISVCVPTYNRQALLERAINSALSQTYKNIEIIVSDNNSEDGTEQMMKKLTEKYIQIKYYKNLSNVGMVANWRNCIQKANGEFYSILDDDNYFLYENYLTEAVSIINANENIKLVFGNFLIRHEGGDMLFTYKLKSVIAGDYLYQHYFNCNIVQELFFVILHRNTALRCDFYRDNLITHDVQSFLISMLEGNAGFVDRLVGAYDVCDDGDRVGLTIPQKWKDYIDYYDRIIRYGKEKKISKKLIDSPFKRQLRKSFYRSYMTHRKNKQDMFWYLNKIKENFGPFFLCQLYLLCFLTVARKKIVVMGKMMVCFSRDFVFRSKCSLKSILKRFGGSL